jgi:hypothetical protein
MSQGSKEIIIRASRSFVNDENMAFGHGLGSKCLGHQLYGIGQPTMIDRYCVMIAKKIKETINEMPDFPTKKSPLNPGCKCTSQ